MNVINILKECPKNIPLMCDMYKDITFRGIDNNLILCSRKGGQLITFDEEGRYSNRDNDGKCVIWPLNGRSWKGINASNIIKIVQEINPNKINKGDILVLESTRPANIIALVSEAKEDGFYSSCFYCLDGTFFEYGGYHKWAGFRYAYKEEKELFNSVLENTGLYWDGEIKSIKYNIGDKLYQIDIDNVFTVDFIKDGYYHDNRGLSISFRNQDKWDIVPPERKFHIHQFVKYDNKSWEITKLTKTSYELKGILNNNELINVSYNLEDKLILIKFNPETLKPFDKVLVRDSTDNKWEIELFSHLTDSGNFVCMNTIPVYCIPFNDNTKHLLGTVKDCEEFYKI